MQQVITVLFALSTFTCLSLAMMAWQRRDIPGALPFSVAMVMGTGYALLSTIQINIQDYDIVLLLATLKAPATIFIPIPALALALHHTRRQRFITNKLRVFMAIIPFATLFMRFTDNPLFIKEVIPNSDLGFVTLRMEYGDWHPILFAYLLMTSVVVFALLTHHTLTTKTVQQRKFTVMLIGGLLTALVTLILNAGTYLAFVVNTLLFPIAGLMFGLAVLRFRLSDIMPFPHDHILTNIPNGLIVLDSHNDVRVINPVMCKILGIKEEDILNKPFSILQSFAEKITQNSKITWKGSHYKVIISDLPKGLLSAQGRVIVLENITEQKQAHQVLKKQLEQREAMHQLNEAISNTQSIEYILKSSLDVIAQACNAECGFIFLTNQNVSGQREQEVRYRYTSELRVDTGVTKRVLQTKRAELIRNIKSDYIANIPTTTSLMVLPIISKDVVLGVINLETSHADDFSEEVFEFIQVLTDKVAVTLDNVQLYKRIKSQYQELQVTHKQVSELESLKTDMIRLAAHDLRNPLSVINAYATLIQLKKDLVGKEMHPIFDQLVSSASRMQDILDSFLSVERIESLTAETTNETFNIVDDIKRAVAEYGLQIVVEGPKLTLETKFELIYVRGDRSLIYEAIINLISNAIKYTPKTGRIIVRLERQGSCMCFKVIDTGFGVPDDMQDSLFKPFSRVKTIETQEIAGIGLGLHLVKNIVDRSGGEVIFNSVYGKGSTFGFKLPMTTDPDPTPVDGYRLNLY